MTGKKLVELGHMVHQRLLEVTPLRSKTTGRMDEHSLFPLPTSRTSLGCIFRELSELELSWLMSICVSLNSFYGCKILYNESPSESQQACLEVLAKDVTRLNDLTAEVSEFDWSSFFASKGIDYKGDEVKTAKSFCWANIKPALPPEVGRVPLSEVCSLGAQHYVNNFDLYIKRPEDWVVKKAPRVMVSDDAWGDVCQGLVSSGICTYIASEDVFHLGSVPLLNGMFGVTKDEWHEGVEVYRLIMNMIPLNAIAEPLKGDIESLPMWSLMSPFFIQPTESLLISSEDVRCFFYTMSVPPAWHKYLAFNKPVPPECVPEHMSGEVVYLAAQVLPMGFLNSVSLAQHVHRNLSLWSGRDLDDVNLPECEIRKDRAITVGNPSWRIYLDNYDLLEKIESVGAGSMVGSLSPAVLALRQEYEHWEVPRNLKKSVSRKLQAEVQGAQVDGVRGIAFPRESKLLKYVVATLRLVEEGHATLKQLQVVCGGLVYVSMFRRPLLGTLNQVWMFMQSFQHDHQRLQLPPLCCLELVRFLGLVPLARLDFRLPYHEQVTCSDASSSGGGICASRGLTRLGQVVSQGSLRGELPELRAEHRVLSIGLFDGIGALRVGLDLLGIQVIGHVSVEKEPSARRVVESHFPEVMVVEDVEHVDHTMVASWGREFSQASVVVLGAGPPCQGVSGLNAGRKGALRDERSRLLTHVQRIRELLVNVFVWCQVHLFMESVSSMDQIDRDHMSHSVGVHPWHCDAGTLTWCSRPRLYWISWEVKEQSGVSIRPSDSGSGGIISLEAYVDLEHCCQEGWLKADPSRPFPTFTTSRPRADPGFKPAGLAQCSSEDLERWKQDDHRYPPYQYRSQHLLVNQHGKLRLPSIQEKEYLMGFPINYTVNCFPKGKKGTQEHLDRRHSLIGNSWCVPVITWFLGQLFSPLGLCPPYTPQDIMDSLHCSSSFPPITSVAAAVAAIAWSGEGH